MTILSPYLEQCAKLLELLDDALVSSREPSDLSYFVKATKALEIPQDVEQSQAIIGEQLRILKAQFDALCMEIERANQDHEVLFSIGKQRSAFAAACIDVALNEAWFWAKTKNLIKGADQPSGLYILGLGKLGGNDLNFSSDVDLIAFFDREIFPNQPHAGSVEAAGKLLSRLGRTLTDPLLEGAGGRFVWRVDWRLRPDPSVNPLAISTGAAIDYYFFHADPWERLALAKARVVAGDVTAGENFINEISPFIWRRNLDFQALDEIAALKQTIHARHPGLTSERERTWRNRGSHWQDWSGFNLKLGVGGIREIEFMVQALQMLWGGRDPSLRMTHCPSTIHALKRADILSPEQANSLEGAYAFLRRAENALQAFQNQQTQTLPQSDMCQQFICQALDCSSPEGFICELVTHTKAVASKFDDLLAKRQPKSADQQAEEKFQVSSSFIDSLDKRALQQWRQLEQAQIPAAKSEAGRKWLLQLLPWISRIVLQSKQPSQTLNKLFQFLGRQPLSASYLETLVCFESVRKTLSNAILHAPTMGILVEQSPFMIDRLVAGPPGDLRKLFDVQRQSARDQEAWLERLRRLVNEELFSAYDQVLSGKLTPQKAEEQLSLLASEAIRAQVINAAEQLDWDPDLVLKNVCVVALGKLGMRTMAPRSDLDLIVVNNAPEMFPNLSRFMARFITGMTMKMREGIAYELDLRLRPNGRSGPAAITKAAFDHHHDKAAKTWEHLALTAGCVLNLSSSLQTEKALEQRCKSILQRRRDFEQARLDAARMLVRLRQHRIQAKENTEQIRFDIKLRPGGLMECEYLVACLTLFSNASSGRHAVDYHHDQRLDVLGLSHLTPSLRFWRDAQWFKRLLDLSHDKPMSEAQSALFLERLGVKSMSEFDEIAKHHSNQILNEINEILPEAKHPADSAIWENYQELPANWVD